MGDIELFLYELNGRGFEFKDKSYSEFGFNDEILNMVYEMWQAAKASAVPEGFVLVPREPTEGMDLKICNIVDHRIDCFEADRIYKAMIEAQEPSHD